MDPFYGPHHDRPSALAAVAGALCQSPHTIEHGLSTPEIRAWIITQYPWANDPPLQPKKGKKATKGEDECARLVNEGIQAGIKHQLVRITSEGTNPIQVFVMPKLQALFPLPEWVEERTNAYFGTDVKKDAVGVARQLPSPFQTATRFLRDHPPSPRNPTSPTETPIDGRPSALVPQEEVDGAAALGTTSLPLAAADSQVPPAQVDHADAEPSSAPRSQPRPETVEELLEPERSTATVTATPHHPAAKLPPDLASSADAAQPQPAQASPRVATRPLSSRSNPPAAVPTSWSVVHDRPDLERAADDGSGPSKRPRRSLRRS